ncbi:MAG: endopeptidase La, partial [Acidimicrobiia bacterium]
MPDTDTSGSAPGTDFDALPLLPLETGVVLPQMVVTLALESPEARDAVDGAAAAAGRVLLVPRTGAGGFAAVGTIARIESEGDLPNGQRAVVLRGLARARVGAPVRTDHVGVWISADAVAERADVSGRAREMAREYKAIVRGIARQLGSPRVADALQGVDDPGMLADTAAWSPDLSTERKIELLETIDPEARIELALEWARATLTELEVGEQIRSRVTENMDKTQREFMLRQQLDAIRKELGEGGADDGDVVEQYRTRLVELAAPDDVRSAVAREIDRLERMNEQSPEHGWIRTWLDTVFDVPWGARSEERRDVVAARAVLDTDHTGLDDVKDRIVEYLAVRKLRAERGMGAPDGAPASVAGRQASVAERQRSRRGSGAILALVGPPGVGKTSLGESVARALGREFVRVALGGVHDEAELRGHRRTYVGARPGRIVRALTEAGTMNPVVLLDEVDKLGADWRGDPSSALLEVLDPAQNHTFRDHYLEVDLDLSDVLFLATANVVETIPGPLLDRLEVLRLDGYTEDEKVAIARDHLLVRQLERNGLRPDDVVVTDDALRRVVVDHTREAGVRNLERELGKLLRKTAARVAAGEAATPITVDADLVQRDLGRAKHWSEVADRSGVPGVVTGLAVTGAGGDVLFVEATATDGEGFMLTGQLGDVMKESAQLALTFVQAHAPDLGIDRAATKRRFHLHVPAGAIPKDGPSAGITMTTALASLLTGRPVRAGVGMTGEVTLQGRVLPIGGVKQKVLAAQRAGLDTVVLPSRNGPDLDDVPEAVRAVMTFHLVDDVREVLDLALEPAALSDAA